MKWLKEYDRMVKFNKWDDRMCLVNVYFLLEGTAKQWYINQEDALTSWEAFKIRLSEFFGDRQNQLSNITKKDVYCLLRIDDTLDCLKGAKFFYLMGICSDYWQIEVDEVDPEKMALITPEDLYEFKVIPFGLCIISATFQRMMDNLLCYLTLKDPVLPLSNITNFDF
ncbi:hypothetical protein AVEN_236754-1 [Araneus ventricosus]|uniref:Retrotransposon gag domain-containing protein n=1 Tax=Araneus ventricosus TaxID=182803 RepID=A0A4Y2JDA9_ARAVE|nr:hypothetical protein AVEN_236754-1 [Araneus ventricosus]